MAKEKKEERKYKVEVVSRDIISVYPRLGEEHKQVIVVYREEKLPTSSITIDLFDLFKEKQFDAASQIEKREGPLWKEYRKVESKLLREDIERRLLRKPEIITI